MSDWAGILWLVLLLIGNAFFVGAEFAIMSARRSQIEPLAEEGSKRARTTLWAMEHVSLMLACAQLGITVCSLLILQVAEPAIHHLMVVPLEAIGLPGGLADGIAFGIALALVTLLIQQVMTKLQERKFAKSERLASVPELLVSANATKATNTTDATTAEISDK